VNYLIDDQIKHCIGASGVGVKSLLYGDYPWNRDVNLPKSVERVSSWKEVEDYFERSKNK
jgi:hypothetical protein